MKRSHSPMTIYLSRSPGNNDWARLGPAVKRKKRSNTSNFTKTNVIKKKPSKITPQGAIIFFL